MLTLFVHFLFTFLWSNPTALTFARRFIRGILLSAKMALFWARQNRLSRRAKHSNTRFSAPSLVDVHLLLRLELFVVKEGSRLLVYRQSARLFSNSACSSSFRDDDWRGCGEDVCGECASGSKCVLKAAVFVYASILFIWDKLPAFLVRLV